MKTIAITVPFGMSARNLLRSDVYKTLSQKSRLIIFSPYAGDSKFYKEFNRENVFIEPLKFDRSIMCSLLQRLMDPVESDRFTRKTKIDTLVIFSDWLRRDHPIRFWWIRFLSLTFGWRPLISILRALYRRAMHSKRVELILRKHRVDRVLVAHVFNYPDQQVGVTAKRMGIEVIGLPHSWDNLTSKSGVRQGTNAAPGRVIPFEFDRWIVWNKFQVEELTKWFGVDKSKIDVSGVPQFDFYLDKEKIKSREAFCQEIGADPKKKIVLYAAGTPQYMRTQDDIIEIVTKTITSGALGPDVQLIIRHHPNRAAVESLKFVEEKLKGTPNVYFLKPPDLYTALSLHEWTIGENDEYDLAHALNAADLVVTMASTITLDTIAFGKPVINITFDGYKQFPFIDSVERSMGYTHYKHILPFHAFRIVDHPDKLADEMKTYLNDPSRDETERKNLLTAFTGQVDGHASQRIAEYLLRDY